MPSPTTTPDELAAPLYLLLVSATPALAGRMMPNAEDLPPLGPPPSSCVQEN
jgi:hypothetical protein